MDQLREDSHTEEPRFNIEQYRMLQRCSEKQDMSEWNKWRADNPNEEVWLQGADFIDFYCAGAHFNYAHCEGAVFKGADCRQAIFYFAHCHGASFENANCKRAIFEYAHCKKAKFNGANCKWATFEGAHCEMADFCGACCENSVFRLSHCEGASFVYAHCERANFRDTYCAGADFMQAYCTGAIFFRAHCESAHFGGTHCEMANFSSAWCEGTEFIATYCEGTDFSNTKLSSNSTIVSCSIDSKTMFANSSLASIIIEPGKRAALERNVRKAEWEQWYKESLTPKPELEKWYQSLIPQPTKDASNIQTDQDKLSFKIKQKLNSWWVKYSPYKNYPAVIAARVFWHISDYGYSTQRILLYFLVGVIAFALLYVISPETLLLSGGVPMKRDWVQLFLFAGATMVTLGFGNINAANTWGMAIVCANLMVGYFMLAVLVTRMAVLFQTMGPGSILPKNSTKQD